MMELSQLLAEATDDVTAFSNLVVACATVLSTVLWSISVFITARTLKAMQQANALQTATLAEMQKATQLQTRAVLVVVPAQDERIASSARDHVETEPKRVQEKWRELLQGVHSGSLDKERALCFRLRNQGKTDIVSWTIHLHLVIESGDYLSSKGIAQRDVLEWTVACTGELGFIGQDEEVRVTMLRFGNFPKAHLSWTATYEDAHGGSHKASYKGQEWNCENRRALQPPATTTVGAFGAPRDAGRQDDCEENGT